VVELDLGPHMVLVGKFKDMAGSLGVGDIESRLRVRIGSPDVGEGSAAALRHPQTRILPVPSLAQVRVGRAVVVACAGNIDEAIFNRLTDKRNFTVIKGSTYDLFNNARFGIIKSGTSTLEAGYFQLPFVVVYSTNFLTYWLGKKVVKINNIAMANILLGEEVIEELIQKDVNSENIYRKSSSILGNDFCYTSIKTKLGRLKEILGGPGASRKAAESIYALLNET